MNELRFEVLTNLDVECDGQIRNCDVDPKSEKRPKFYTRTREIFMTSAEIYKI
jgi:hypothetical protein